MRFKIGYTHYFRRKPVLDRVKFTAAANDLIKLVDRLHARTGLRLQREYKDPSLPVFGPDLIEFNGVDGDGYEDFHAPREYDERFISPDPEGRLFAFCKTNHQKYNWAVIGALIVLAHHFGNDFRVSSDGTAAGGLPEDDWQMVMAECQEVLGYGGDFKFHGDDANAAVPAA